jgi:hypothetical protein
MNPGQYREFIGWTILSILLGCGLEGLVGVVLLKSDHIMRVLYKQYREQGIKDPMESVRDTDRRMLYDPFKWFTCIMWALFGAFFIVDGLIRIIKY